MYNEIKDSLKNIFGAQEVAFFVFSKDYGSKTKIKKIRIACVEFYKQNMYNEIKDSLKIISLCPTSGICCFQLRLWIKT